MKNEFMLIQKIIDAEIIFLDFDGVIKESTEIKTEGFRVLFQDQGEKFSQQVVDHHLAHQGMPRQEKIHLYLSWLGSKPTNEMVDKWCSKFSKLVFLETLNCPWVPGILDYLVQNYTRHKFIVISAMPQLELNRLLQDLSIKRYFIEANGYPVSKKNAIANSLIKYGILPKKAIFIGDAEADLKAALANYVPFILRKTSSNEDFQKRYQGTSISNFLDILNAS